MNYYNLPKPSFASFVNRPISLGMGPVKLLPAAVRVEERRDKNMPCVSKEIYTHGHDDNTPYEPLTKTKC